MRQRALFVFSLALLCLGPMAVARAAGANASLAVQVQIRQPSSSALGASPSGSSVAASSSGICGSSLTRSVVSIGCPGQGPSTPLQVMAFTNRETLVSTFDVYAGGARILGWQVLSLDDREYLEMTLGW